MIVLFVTGVIVWLLSMVGAAQTAARKGISPGAGFVLGLLLGLLGWAIVALMAPRQAAVAPGWHPDPWGAAPLRWHDGQQWTPHVHEAMQP